MLRTTISLSKRIYCLKYSRASCYQFCKDKPPQGFEKFKRQQKPPQNQQVKEQPKVLKDGQEFKKEQSEQKIQYEEQNEKEEEISNQEDTVQQKQSSKDSHHDSNEQQKERKGKKQSHQHNQNQDQKSFYQHPVFMGVMFGLPIAYLYGDHLLEQFGFRDGSSIVQFEFENYLTSGEIARIEILKTIKEEGTQIVGYIFLKSGMKKTIEISNIDYFLSELENKQLDKGQMIPVTFNVQHSNDAHQFFTAVKWVLLAGLLITLYVRSKSFTGFQGSGKDMGAGKQFKAKQFEKKIKIKFSDVAGLDEAKGEIKEFVDFLKAPSKYQELGAKIPKGALLTGPPGTGKTLLAKACAGEAGVPFFQVSGSEFVEMFVGLGASRVRELFKQAKAKAPSIIFIDEIDAVGKKRNSKGSKNEERDNTLNQLLVEMDGFGTNTNVIVLAATNMKDTLDAALTRPGRFDRSVEITLPDIEGRKSIFLVHLKPIKLDPKKTIEEYANRLATLTPGFSGAEIANLCNEAAILAARNSKLYVGSEEFESASERVMAGLEKKKFISEEERKVIAFHESGHAVVSWFLEGGDPLLKLTIIPRSKGSLGYAQYLPNESSLQTYNELIDKICCVLGGRISEEHYFNEITTGAYDDLKKAYNIAHQAITKFGMSETLGNIGYEEGQFIKDYGEDTNKIIDDEINKLISNCTVRTRNLITLHKTHIENLANKLLEKETLDLQMIINILGERPYAPKSNYKAYLDLKRVQQSELTEQVQQEKDNEQKQKNTQEAK